MFKQCLDPFNGKPVTTLSTHIEGEIVEASANKDENVLL
jgi:hypothetical protein